MNLYAVGERQNCSLFERNGGENLAQLLKEKGRDEKEQKRGDAGGWGMKND